MTTEIDDVPNFDITVKKESLVDDMFEIYSHLFKDKAISKDQLSFEELCGGYVNAIWKVTPKDKSRSSLIFRTFSLKFNEAEMAKMMVDLPEESKPSEDVAQNPGDKLMFSRMSEYKVMQVVSEHGLSQPVYATYKNGIVYGFAKGFTVTGELMLTNDFLKEAATKLARFHSIKYEVPGIKYKTQLERLDLQFGPPFEAMIKEAYAKLEQEGMPYPYNEMPSIQVQLELDEKIMSLLREAGLGRIVLCHNDTNQNNIVWDPQTRRLEFIDFEMTMANHPGFEIGSLFSCYAGHFLYSYNKDLFPNEDYRRCFLRTYLEEFYKLNELDADSEKFETELEDLFHQANLAALRGILGWTSLGAFFDFQPNMFQNKDIKKESDKYYAGKFSLKCYRLFQELYEPFFEGAKRHFAKRKQASS